MKTSVSISGTMPCFEARHPTNIEAHMIVARDLMESVSQLSSSSNISPRGCASLAAQTLECILKAFLLFSGEEEKKLKYDLGHDLNKLWKAAQKHGDHCVGVEHPEWVKTLSAGHGPHYYFRYQEGKDRKPVDGGGTPLLPQMTEELITLLKRVEAVISK